MRLGRPDAEGHKVSKDTSTICPNPDVKSPSVVKDRSLIIFSVHPRKYCYRISRVQASGCIGKLYVTGRATRELVRALWMPVRTWCKVNITWYSRWVFVGADITCPVSAIEWIQANRNWKIVCRESC